MSTTPLHTKAVFERAATSTGCMQLTCTPPCDSRTRHSSRSSWPALPRTRKPDYQACTPAARAKRTCAQKTKRDDLKRAVRDVAAKHRPFRASFAEFAVLENDDQTRAFVVLEIGAGHEDFVKLTRDVDKLLVSIGQEPYYAEPRFHASFAWWLLQPPSASSPTAPSAPTALLDELRSCFSENLRKVGTVDVGAISLRIGKAVDSWALTGNNAGSAKSPHWL